MIRYKSHISDKCFGRALLPLKSPKDNPKIAKSEMLSKCCIQVKHFTADCTLPRKTLHYFTLSTSYKHLALSEVWCG